MHPELGEMWIKALERGEGPPRDMRACMCGESEPFVTLLSQIEMQPPLGALMNLPIHISDRVDVESYKKIKKNKNLCL